MLSSCEFTTQVFFLKWLINGWFLIFVKMSGVSVKKTWLDLFFLKLLFLDGPDSNYFTEFYSSGSAS